MHTSTTHRLNKMEINTKKLTDYDLCKIFLGLSMLFGLELSGTWVVSKHMVAGCILITQASLPRILQFCSCAGMIDLSYTSCGWIVLRL